MLHGTRRAPDGQMHPRWGSRERNVALRGARIVQRFAGGSPEVTKVASRGPKMAPKEPKMAPRGPKMAPRGPKMAPREPKMAPRGPKMAPKDLRMVPRDVPDGPKGGPKCTKHEDIEI